MLYLAMALAVISGVQLFLRFFRDLRRREAAVEPAGHGVEP
jgi:hypothetical protein